MTKAYPISSPPYHIKSQTQTSLLCRHNCSWPRPTCVPDATHSNSSKITNWLDWTSTCWRLPTPVIWGSQDELPPKCLAQASRGESPRDSSAQYRWSSTYEFKLNQGPGDTAAKCGGRGEKHNEEIAWRTTHLSWVLDKSKILAWESWNMEWAKGWSEQ